jgi:Flp pilus assembly protein TadB
VACIHGYDPGSCVICSTLGSAPPRDTTRRRRRTPGTGAAARVEVLRTGAAQRRHGGRLGVHALALVGVLVLAGLSFWLVTSIVYAVVRLAELVVVAGVAGALGYRVGRARGRRDH